MHVHTCMHLDTKTRKNNHKRHVTFIKIMAEIQNVHAAHTTSVTPRVQKMTEGK